MHLDIRFRACDSIKTHRYSFEKNNGLSGDAAVKSFASDNYSPIAPEILEAIISANQDHQPSYGNDIYTQQAEELLRETFGAHIKSFFAYNGTAANVAGLKAILKSHHAIICSDLAHIVVHEVNAATNMTGCPTLLIQNHDGKITADEIQVCYDNATYWGYHANLPKVVSITQSTEVGTVYTRDELLAISAVCKKNQLLFHMDGCRLSNAAAALNCSLKDITTDVGVDVLSFGGTKNGLMLGEAIIFFKPELSNEFAYIHKQSLQLNSKMRFLSAQFIPYLKDKLWHRYAAHANKMAKLLSDGLSKIKGVTINYPVQTNQVFATVPEKLIQATIEKYPYYIRDKKINQVRLVTSFDTTEEEINHFTELASK